MVTQLIDCRCAADAQELSACSKPACNEEVCDGLHESISIRHLSCITRTQHSDNDFQAATVLPNIYHAFKNKSGICHLWLACTRMRSIG